MCVCRRFAKLLAPCCGASRLKWMPFRSEVRRPRQPSCRSIRNLLICQVRSFFFFFFYFYPYPNLFIASFLFLIPRFSSAVHSLLTISILISSFFFPSCFLLLVFRYFSFLSLLPIIRNVTWLALSLAADANLDWPTKEVLYNYASMAPITTEKGLPFPRPLIL